MKAKEILLRRCKNGYVIKTEDEETVHMDAYSVWMKIGDSLLPEMSGEEVLEEIIRHHMIHLNLRFTKIQIKDLTKGEKNG